MDVTKASPASPVPPLPPARPPVRTLGVLLALACLLAWSNSLHGPFVYDDYPSIFFNPTLRPLWPLGPVLHPPTDGGMTVAGRPVLNLSLALNIATGNTDVLGFHLTNLAIHILATLALFGIVRRWYERLTEPSSRIDSALVAAAAALLWGLHPLQTESVTYIIQRAESLMGLFYLLTLYGFVRSLDGRHPRLWQALSVAACLLGMGTKEVMVSAPVIVLACDALWAAGSLRSALRQRAGYYGALAGTWVLLGWLVASTHGRGNGTFNPGVSWVAYWLTQPAALLHYLRLTLWPSPLIFEYGAEWLRSPWDAVLPTLLIAGLAGLTAWGLGRRKPWALPALVFFAILAPTSVIAGGRQTLAEHRMYLALAPLAVLAALGLWRLAGRRGLLVALAAGIGLGCATHARNNVYRDDLALWQDTASKRPHNPVALHNYGYALYQRHRLSEAEAAYEAALAVEPDYAKAASNLGAALLADNKIDEGIRAYERAISLRPDYEDAQFCLAEALAGSGHLREAIGHYEAAIALRPRDAQAVLGLARVYAQQGDLNRGITEASQAARLAPDLAPAHLELGKMLAQAGRLSEARAELERAKDLDPEDPVAPGLIQRINAYLAR